MNKAVYPGSFDPFTYGHLDVVLQSAKLFDELTIIIASNKDKKRMYDANDMKSAIEYVLNACKITNVKVVVYDGLIANFMYVNDVFYLVRGLRNNMDYNYEENIAKINNLINPKIKTIYFRATSHISSSMVKELHSLGEDVGRFVPNAIFDLMKKENIKNEKN